MEQTTPQIPTSTVSEDVAQGYLTSIPYTYTSFFSELTPVHLKTVAALRGLKSPDIDKPFTYLELGSGHGMTLNLTAAANPNGEFHGVDFMPEHVQFSKEYAENAGIKNVHFHQDAFGELDLDALPDFDFIVAHGIIAWISGDIREQIETIVNKKLKQGGLFYVSYNAMPGWADKQPIVEIMEYLTNEDLPPIDRLKQGFGLAKKLSDDGALYFQVNKRVDTELQNLAKRNASYLAHEFLNEKWRAFYFRQICKPLMAFGLEFAGNAFLRENLPQLYIPKKFYPLLQNINDVTKFEGVVDFILDNQFRRDVYLRTNGQSYRCDDPIEAFEGMHFYRLKPGDESNQEEVKMGNQTYKLNHPFYEVLRNMCLGSSVTVQDMIKEAETLNLPQNDALAMIKFFIALKQVIVSTKPVSGDDLPVNADIQKTNKQTIKFYGMKEKRVPLVSSVTGSEIKVSAIIALILQAVAAGKESQEDIYNWILEQDGIEQQERLKNHKADIEDTIQKTLNVFLPEMRKLGVDF